MVTKHCGGYSFLSTWLDQEIPKASVSHTVHLWGFVTRQEDLPECVLRHLMGHGPVLSKKWGKEKARWVTTLALSLLPALCKRASSLVFPLRWTQPPPPSCFRGHDRMFPQTMSQAIPHFSWFLSCYERSYKFKLHLRGHSFSGPNPENCN